MRVVVMLVVRLVVMLVIMRCVVRCPPDRRMATRFVVIVVAAVAARFVGAVLMMMRVLVANDGFKPG